MSGLFQAMFDKVEESKSEVILPNAPITPAGYLRGQQMLDEMHRSAEAIRLIKKEQNNQ